MCIYVAQLVPTARVPCRNQRDHDEESARTTCFLCCTIAQGEQRDCTPCLLCCTIARAEQRKYTPCLFCCTIVRAELDGSKVFPNETHTRKLQRKHRFRKIAPFFRQNSLLIVNTPYMSFVSAQMHTCCRVAHEPNVGELHY